MLSKIQAVERAAIASETLLCSRPWSIPTATYCHTAFSYRSHMAHPRPRPLQQMLHHLKQPYQAVGMGNNLLIYWDTITIMPALRHQKELMVGSLLGPCKTLRAELAKARHMMDAPLLRSIFTFLSAS